MVKTWKLEELVGIIDQECTDIMLARGVEEGHETIRKLGEPYLEQVIACKALRNIEHRAHGHPTDDDLLDLINYARFELMIRRGWLDLAGMTNA